MNKNTSSRPHQPIMVNECLKFFEPVELITFFDGTLGAGGHAKSILEAHPEIETYIGCDRDPEALELAKEVLKPWKEKVVLIHGNFSDLDRHLAKLKIKTVNGFFLI